MTSTVTLPARLDLPAAGPLLASLIEARGEALALNGAEVTHLGTNCLQILISAVKTWTEDANELSFVDLSDEFSQQLENFGLTLDTLNDGASPL